METLGYFFFGFLGGLLVPLIGLVWAAEPSPRAPPKPVVDFDKPLVGDRNDKCNIINS
jgi:hypothetical protein